MPNEMNLPTAYLSIQKYFNDYYKFRKSQDFSFTHEIWSAELGFKSKSFLRMICSGQRPVTHNLVEIFSQKNLLNDLQKNHLNLIMLYQKTKIESEKKIYLDKIFESLDTDPKNYEIKQYAKFISNLDLVTIQMLLIFQDGPRTIEELEALVPLSESEIKEKLLDLLDMGLVDLNQSSGRQIWTASSKSFTMKDQEMSSALQEYYQLTLKEAAVKSNLSLFDFKTIFFALEDDQAEILKEECSAFLKKLRNRFSSSSLKNKKLYKVNLISYPLTEKNKN